MALYIFFKTTAAFITLRRTSRVIQVFISHLNELQVHVAFSHSDWSLFVKVSEFGHSQHFWLQTRSSNLETLLVSKIRNVREKDSSRTDWYLSMKQMEIKYNCTTNPYEILLIISMSRQKENDYFARIKTLYDCQLLISTRQIINYVRKSNRLTGHGKCVSSQLIYPTFSY
jgi:hypothetical protein